MTSEGILLLITDLRLHKVSIFLYQGLLYVEVPEGAPQQPRLNENSWGLLLVFKPTTGTALLLNPTLTVHCKNTSLQLKNSNRCNYATSC